MEVEEIRALLSANGHVSVATLEPMSTNPDYCVSILLHPRDPFNSPEILKSGPQDGPSKLSNGLLAPYYLRIPGMATVLVTFLTLAPSLPYFLPSTVSRYLVPSPVACEENDKDGSWEGTTGDNRGLPPSGATPIAPTSPLPPPLAYEYSAIFRIIFSQLHHLCPMVSSVFAPSHSLHHRSPRANFPNLCFPGLQISFFNPPHAESCWVKWPKAKWAARDCTAAAATFDPEFLLFRQFRRIGRRTFHCCTFHCLLHLPLPAAPSTACRTFPLPAAPSTLPSFTMPPMRAFRSQNHDFRSQSLLRGNTSLELIFWNNKKARPGLTHVQSPVPRYGYSIVASRVPFCWASPPPTKPSTGRATVYHEYTTSQCLPRLCTLRNHAIASDLLAANGAPVSQNSSHIPPDATCPGTRPLRPPLTTHLNSPATVPPLASTCPPLSPLTTYRPSVITKVSLDRISFPRLPIFPTSPTTSPPFNPKPRVFLAEKNGSIILAKPGPFRKLNNTWPAMRLSAPVHSPITPPPSPPTTRLCSGAHPNPYRNEAKHLQAHLPSVSRSFPAFWPLLRRAAAACYPGVLEYYRARRPLSSYHGRCAPRNSRSHRELCPNHSNSPLPNGGEPQGSFMTPPKRLSVEVESPRSLKLANYADTTVPSVQSGDLESRGHSTLVDTNRTAADEPPAAPANKPRTWKGRTCSYFWNCVATSFPTSSHMDCGVDIPTFIARYRPVGWFLSACFGAPRMFENAWPVTPWSVACATQRIRVLRLDDSSKKQTTSVCTFVSLQDIVVGQPKLQIQETPRPPNPFSPFPWLGFCSTSTTQEVNRLGLRTIGTTWELVCLALVEIVSDDDSNHTRHLLFEPLAYRTPASRARLPFLRWRLCRGQASTLTTIGSIMGPSLHSEVCRLMNFSAHFEILGISKAFLQIRGYTEIPEPTLASAEREKPSLRFSTVKLGPMDIALASYDVQRMGLRLFLVFPNFSQPLCVPETHAIGCPVSCSILSPYISRKIEGGANRSLPEEPPRPCTCLLMVRLSLCEKFLVSDCLLNDYAPSIMPYQILHCKQRIEYRFPWFRNFNLLEGWVVKCICEGGVSILIVWITMSQNQSLCESYHDPTTSAPSGIYRSQSRACTGYFLHPAITNSTDLEIPLDTSESDVLEKTVPRK
ncbi:uncharacterized protein CLUP02_04858 [Colletotrichum lupini]|uniref:Uncharacterized protein n=1 Tax=Colletotrichum lupini TaxID=145971 RepID=A0A9Q8SL59_9PEZI|nr:uncharacterized protein CLUP02_04858 [Colletotrichum lupini]UQC79379.1 hypothetical protein CLUP02_04858 [Colletotrichum lupini]